MKNKVFVTVRIHEDAGTHPCKCRVSYFQFSKQAGNWLCIFCGGFGPVHTHNQTLTQ